MNFSPPDFTFSDFESATEIAFSQFHFLESVDCEVEDAVPWVNIVAKRVIKPKEALSMMESLQKNIIDEVLFHSLSGRNLRIVVNSKFHFTPEELTFGAGFQEDYAHDFGCPITEMKGADLNSYNKISETPLHFAIKNNHTDIVDTFTIYQNHKELSQVTNHNFISKSKFKFKI